MDKCKTTSPVTSPCAPQHRSPVHPVNSPIPSAQSRYTMSSSPWQANSMQMSPGAGKQQGSGCAMKLEQARKPCAHVLHSAQTPTVQLAQTNVWSFIYSDIFFYNNKLLRLSSLYMAIHLGNRQAHFKSPSSLFSSHDTCQIFEAILLANWHYTSPEGKTVGTSTSTAGVKKGKGNVWIIVWQWHN